MADFDLDFVGPGARLAFASASRAAASETAAAASAAKALEFGAPFGLYTDLTAATGMVSGDPATVSALDTGTHAALAGEIGAGNVAATVGDDIPNEGSYKYDGSNWLRSSDSAEQSAAAQVTLANAAVASVQPLAIYTNDMLGDGEAVVPFVREVSAISAASGLYGISGGFGDSIDPNRPLTGIGLNLALGADSDGTVAQSFKLFLVKKLLTDSDLNTASPETWTAVQEVLFDSDAVAALGLTAGVAPSTTNMVFARLNFTDQFMRGDDYAGAWYILGYTGTDGTGNLCNVYRGLTNVTGDPAYIRGFTQNSAGTWSARSDGSGHAFVVYGEGAYSTSDMEARLTTVENLTAKAEGSFTTEEVASYSFAGASVVPADTSSGFHGFKLIRPIEAGRKVSTVGIPAALPATADTMRLSLYRRQSADTFLTTYPNVTMRLRELIGTISLTVAETGLVAGGDAGDVPFDVSSLLPWGHTDTLIEFDWDCYDSGGAVITASGAGTGFRYTGGAASPNYLGGWYVSRTGTITAAQLGITINVEQYASSGSGSSTAYVRRTVESLDTASIAGNVLSLAGSMKDPNGVASNFSGDVTVTLPTTYRYDAILVDPTSGALSSVAGTEQSSGWAASVSPGAPTGSAILLGYLACDSTEAYAFVPTWDVSGPVRRSMLASHQQEAITAKSNLRMWLRTLYAGASTTITAVGDSRTRVGSTGSGDTYTPNGQYRDRADTFFSYDTALQASVLAGMETFDRDSVTHYYFGPWAETWKRLLDGGVTASFNNLGNNGQLSTLLADTDYQNAIIATDPDLLIIAFGMNDINTEGNAATYQTRIANGLTWAAANLPNLKGVIVEATPRPNASGFASGALLATWQAFQDAVQTAVTTFNNRSGVTDISPKAIAIPSLIGFDENAGLSGVAPVDRMTCNGGNHDGPREKRWIRDYLWSLIFGDN